MIMLVEPANEKGQGFLKRLRQSIEVTELTVLGMGALKMTVPVGRFNLNRLRQRAVRIPGIYGINTVFIRDDFPYPEWFENFRRPDGRELTRRLLGIVASSASEDHESVYAYAKRMDKSVYAALTELCCSFRHVMIGGLCEKDLGAVDEISHKCGVSILTDPPENRIARADAAVLFDRPENMIKAGERTVSIAADLDFYGCVSCRKMVTSIELETDAPEGFSQAALFSEAILRGKRRFEDICLKRLEKSP